MFHDLAEKMPVDRRSGAYKITAIYILVGGLWVLFSDQLLAMVLHNVATISRLQTLKGWFFILATGGMLYLLTGREIAAFQKVQDALRASEKKYRELADLLPQIIFEIDTRGNLTYANRNAFLLFGYSRELFWQDRNVFDLIVPQDRERAMENTHRVLEGEDLSYQEYTAVREDGSTFPVAVHSNPILEDDRPLGLRGIVFDLTEIKNTENALKESEEQYRRLYEESKRAEEVYRSLLHTSADAIVVYDMEGRTKYINPSFTKIFGWSMEEVEGKEIPFVPASEKDETMEGIREIVGDGRAIQGFETKRHTKDGRLIDVNLSGSRYNDHEGKPAGMLVILRDTSKQKQLERQFQLAQRMEAIGTLAGGIAHNFNNLLMGIQGNASIALLETDQDDPIHIHIENIQNIVRSGSKLTNQLLGYAMGGRYEVKPVSLNQLVRTSAETFGATKREVTVHLDLDERLFAVEADSSQIEQVLMNIYVNAADAMPGGGDIFLKTANITHRDMGKRPYKIKQGDYVMLTVRDTGIGMDRETEKRIFEPFFTTKGLEKGTGLGLASAYGIVKSHGGYIDVQSENGRGTVFEIFLPATQKEALQKEKEALRGKEGNGELSESRGTVLLVDDEEMITKISATILKKLGYDVLIANSGKEALEIYGEKGGEIDIVILDIIMPDMGGGDVFDRLREMDPHVKVLLASGYSIDGRAEEILSRGCKGFLQKPFGMKTLSKKMREVLFE